MKGLTRLLCCTLLIVSWCSARRPQQTTSEWGLFIHLDARDQHHNAVKHLNDIIAGAAGTHLTIALQLVTNDTAYRYIVKDHALHHNSTVQTTHSLIHDVSNGMKWATSLNAQHYCCMLHTLNEQHESLNELCSALAHCVKDKPLVCCFDGIAGTTIERLCECSSAHTFVGSARTGYNPHWDYQKILKGLTAPLPAPLECAERIAHACGSQAQLTAFEVKGMNELLTSLDQFSRAASSCITKYGQPFKQLILDARHEQPSDDIIDIYHFLSAFLQRFDAFQRTQGLYADLRKMRKAALDVQRKMRAASTTQETHGGLGIYFPLTTVDEQYLATFFAQKTEWYTLLKRLVS